nr:hypothetical protein [Candidatus Cloacimonadota bacterium]
MNILIIPSWYPHPKDPLAGRFFLDQAIALAKHSDHSYKILNYGQNRFQIRLRRAFSNLAVLHDYRQAKPERLYHTDRLEEIRIPHLSWTSSITRGNLNSFDLAHELKPDLIYALVTFPAGFIAQQLAEKWDVPYIIAEHSGPFPFPEFLHKGKLSDLLAKPIQNASKIIAVSNYIKEQILFYTGREADVIPNMVDTNFWVPSSKQESRDEIRLFSMSTFTQAKGVEDLLEALYILWKKRFKFSMVWAGDGPLYAQIKKNAAKLPIKFCGTLNKMQARTQYQKSDLYVMPSRIESFSMVLIEAMSCGIPSVATDCGGPADIINATTGILCKSNNPGSIANAIISFKDQQNRFDAGKIRTYCLNHYSENIVCKKLISAFEESISR